MMLTLPWPPSVNRYWRLARGRLYLGRAGRDFRAAVAAQVHESVKPQAMFKTTERLAIVIQAYPPDKRRRDLDNLLKATLDSLEHAGVFPDDEQLDRIFIQRNNVRRGGELEVSIGSIRQSH